MFQGKDKVSDVLAVLTIMREEFKRSSKYSDTTELRKQAIREVAERGLREKRYKNQDSAVKSIRDACARRLKPDVHYIAKFDKLADQWLQQNSLALKDILLGCSVDDSQRALVSDFFAETA